jgi:hypothetical protein
MAEHRKPYRSPAGRCDFARLTVVRSVEGFLAARVSDGDEVVGDDAELDPALDPVIALVSTAGEAVPAFDDADASLASGTPFLAVAEPALLLRAFARGAFGGAIGDVDALDASPFAAVSFFLE